jgi:hypothetical protein
MLYILLIVIGIYFFKNYEFKQGSYYKLTHNTFLFTILDAGRNGEYQIYKRLSHYERTGGKFLFNCYLPKENGETTEIDVVLIKSDGIFVFESKNYSGWIFGDEKSKNWTQTLPQGKGRSHKERFFNPILQNEVHIKWLRRIVGDGLPIYSIIAFSERCTLKKVSVTSQDVQVINRNVILSAVEHAGSMQSRKLSREEVDETYNKLYPFTQVSEEQKLQHVHNIRAKHSTLRLYNEKVSFRKDTNEKELVSKVCPNCSALLVLRTAKKGINSGQQFYGCSNYPKCKYIR